MHSMACGLGLSPIVTVISLYRRSADYLTYVIRRHTSVIMQVRLNRDVIAIVTQ